MSECDPSGCLHLECMRDDFERLESLVRDMWVQMCCASSGFDISEELGELGERMKSLGIGVE